MKKALLLIIILLLCGCVPKLTFKDTKEYIYTNYNRDKVTKFVVETDTLLGKHCYEINKEEGLKELDSLEIKKETKMYSTDSDMYYRVYFEDGTIKSFKFNGGNLVYKYKYYLLNGLDSFKLDKKTEIDCANNKVNHNLTRININNEYNLYYYEIETAISNVNNSKMDLKDALINKEITIDEIVSKLKIDESFYDGGTTIYKNDKFFIDDLEVLKCNTLEGNKDVYVGKNGMGYRNNFCTKDNRTFTRTYKVKSIEDYKHQQYENGVAVSYAKSIKVVLSENNNEVKSVILNNFWNNIEVDKTYEFELMPNYDAKMIDSIESIFKNSIIVGVKETDKEGINQIKDDIFLRKQDGIK